MKIRFLLDENLSPKLKSALLRLNPKIDIMRVGEENMPPLGTLDPEILIYLEMSKRLQNHNLSLSNNGKKEMEILEKLHRLSVVKLVHLESYIEKLLSEDSSNRLKAS